MKFDRSNKVTNFTYVIMGKLIRYGQIECSFEMGLWG